MKCYLAQLETTLGYIGTLGSDERRVPAVYTFDLRALNKVPKQGWLNAAGSLWETF